MLMKGFIFIPLGWFKYNSHKSRRHLETSKAGSVKLNSLPAWAYCAAWHSSRFAPSIHRVNLAQRYDRRP